MITAPFDRRTWLATSYAVLGTVVGAFGALALLLVLSSLALSFTVVGALVVLGGTLIYTSPSPGVSTAVGDFPGLALMDLMKPYMPPTLENYEQVLRDIHARTIQMWAGCIWVPIYEVMTRKHLKLVTLEENLEMAADIGMDATTSLDEAFAEAMGRHGPDAKVIVLPFARYQLPRNMVRMDAEPLRFPQEAHAH